MAETLTPNSILIKNQKPSVAAPTSPFFLGSNDDQLERAAARAARAAAFRRKPVEVPHPRNSLSSDPCLDRDQIMELFRNCVKLASENKINQKNTWELNLIDHLSEIIQVETEGNNAETNFQKASCTLETGVKIYAVRVDACHADAYRVLNGICRAGLENGKEISTGWNTTEKETNGGRPVKETERKVSPLSTVESSFEALNVKKFDVAFAVDPLYHQTSAQFDEGGAKGLLLSNLGVYGDCKVLFDSQEVPARCTSLTSSNSGSALVDLSFAKDCIEPMVTNLHQKQEISPSLGDLIKQFGEFALPSRISDDTTFFVNKNVIDLNKDKFNVDKGYFGTSNTAEDIGAWHNYDSCNDNEAWSADLDDFTTVSNEGINTGAPTMQNYNGDPMSFMPNESAVSDSFENSMWLFFKELGSKSVHNAWAGPEHWIFSRRNGSGSLSAPDSSSDCPAKKTRKKSSLVADIDFTINLDEEVPDSFVPVKNPKSLLLPPRKFSYSNKLPEDCHYQPEDLAKLFLLPNVMCLGKKRKKVAGHDSLPHRDDFDDSFSSWDNESTVDHSYDDVHTHRNAEDDILVSEPYRVDKIEVEYDKTSKQVNVHVLKETLWTVMQGSIQTPEVDKHVDAISFRHVLTLFPDDCKAASTSEISPHLCFICLLHLANEHGLSIVGCPDLDDLCIHLPVGCEESGEVIQSSA